MDGASTAVPPTHMTGRRELFSDLDTSVRGSVRFGDASRVEIQGMGLIVFEGKTGEHHVLHDVYYILGAAQLHHEPWLAR